MAEAEVAVVGGSGFYRFLEGATDHHIETPYGEPSGPVAVGRIGGRSVAFLPRHGPGHRIPPHRINARANVWALASLGVQWVIGPCACGSLQAPIAPGDLVVLDQLVDRTWGRPDTFLDGPEVHHVSFADPYCPQLREVLVEQASRSGGWPAGGVHAQGSVVVVQGPRFSTRAESSLYRDAGFDVINMTQYPEAYLARELGMCYAALALVTDRDVGMEGDPASEPVTMEAAMAVLEANVEHTRRLLAAVIPNIPQARTCRCALSKPAAIVV